MRFRVLKSVRFSAIAAAFVSVAVLSTACQGEPDPDPTPTPTPSPSPSVSASVQPTRAFPNLNFTQPVFVTSAQDGSNRLFVVEQGGTIRVFKNSDSVLKSQVFLDISSKVSQGGGEMGLLGLAFDPSFKTNGRFYVYYIAEGPRRAVLERYQVSAADANVANAASGTVLLNETKVQGYSNHNGGMIAFGADHMLYIGMGDAGSEGDPDRNSQNRANVWGKVLRINPNGGTPYSIPSDNPFVNAGASVRKEIWAYGLRNPWRFSFDRVTGQLWLADVGNSLHEEIDLVHSGDNLGWSDYEGTEAFNAPSGSPATPYVFPVKQFDHPAAVAIMGGYVYHGKSAPSLANHYVCGDFGTGIIYSLATDGQKILGTDQIGTISQITSFGEDEGGEVFAVSQGGTLWRFTETTTPPDTMPQLLSATGAFTDTAGLVASAGLLEYNVNTPLWSDGAHKRRWISLPQGQKITFKARDSWDFPVGTRFIKQFDLDLNPASGDGSHMARLETRFLIKSSSGWSAYTYQWNDAGTDATLVTDGATKDYTITDVGGTRVQTWTVPSQGECMQCHTDVGGKVLGVRTFQLNRTLDYPSGHENQLEHWNGLAMFNQDIGAAANYDAYADASDNSQTIQKRARSYLASNCAHCHQPGGPTPVDQDFRFDTPNASMKAIGVAPQAGSFGIADAQRIYAGHKESSVLYYRITTTGQGRMPPVGRSVSDPIGTELIGDWIDTL